MWWSDSFYHLFGYDTADNAVRTASFWFEAIHPDDRKRVRESINNIIQDNTTRWVENYRFRRANGTYARVTDRANIMHDEFGTPYRMLGSLMDVTELKETEQQLKQKNDDLQHLFEEFVRLPYGRVSGLARPYTSAQSSLQFSHFYGRAFLWRYSSGTGGA